MNFMSDQLNDIFHETGCPKCGSPLTEPVKFTWWGGVLGPKLFHHTRCMECKYCFNSKTRQSNTNAIIIYSIVLFGVVFAVFFVLRNSFR